MNSKRLLYFLFCVISVPVFCQTEPSEVDDTKYYYQIPDYPEVYNAGTVAARIVDGLGFRFFHATADLNEENLKFKPSEEARTLEQTIDHILGLTRTTINSVNRKPTDFSIKHPELIYQEKRTKILENIRKTSEILKRSSAEDLTSYQIIFISGDGSRREYPFWNQINGPIADAIWHTGQIVSLRRTSGNPFNSKASVLSGKVREN